MTSITDNPRREMRVLGLISTGHFMSHYSQLALYPLFPLMHDDFGVGYAALGLIVTILNATGAVAQIPIGFLVDRMGAKRILIAGLFIKTLAIGSMALTSSYEALLLLAAIAGLGNAVFHPADYSILMSTINERRIGRAFSIHTASGSAGSALAPIAILSIAALWDWRTAVLSVALFGAVTGIAMILQARVMQDHAERERKTDRPKNNQSVLAGLRMLMSPNVLILYLFFMMTAMISIGLNSFSVTALVELYATPLPIAGAALTIFLGGGFLGVLFGGYLADRTSRHDLVAACAFLLSAMVILLIGGVKLPNPVMLCGFGLIGIFLGTIRPARDMMVRAITQQGDGGKMFGFMSNGHQVAGIIVPVLFGWIIDQGAVQWIFWLSAIFMGLALLSLFSPARRNVGN
jgi:predicted MFS family arabinose efflux permease